MTASENFIAHSMPISLLSYKHFNAERRHQYTRKRDDARYSSRTLP
jgi:hypothetical protein